MRAHHDVNAHIAFTALIQASPGRANLPLQAVAKPATRRPQSNETDDEQGSNLSRASVSHDMGCHGYALQNPPLDASRLGRGDPVLTGPFEVIGVKHFDLGWARKRR